MKFKQWWPNGSVLVLTQLLLLLVAITLPLVQWNVNASQQWGAELQQLTTHSLRQEQALSVLQEHRQGGSTLNAGAESVDSITLSLIEAVKHHAWHEQLVLTELTVFQSDQPVQTAQSGSSQLYSAADESSIYALRVDFAVTLDRAMHLLPLIDALKEAAGWHPVEVRGCSMVRLTESPVSLRATCSVDVYYFPLVDTVAQR